VPDPEIVGLMVAGGQNAAFASDTFTLHTWYADSTGAPMGVFPSGVRWTSSDSSVVEPIADTAFVARALGRVILTAEAPVDGAVFTATREFHVIDPVQGRLTWIRGTGPLQRFQLAWMDLPGRAVRVVTAFDGADGLGLAAPSPDRRLVAVQVSGYPGGSPLSRIYLVDLASGAVTALTDSVPGNQIAPRWSADGTEVLFAANPAGWNIWSAPIAGGPARMRLRLDWPSPVFFDASRSTPRVIVELANPQTNQSELWEGVLDSGLAGPSGNEGGGARMSPSGQLVAYQGFSERDRTYVVLITRGGAAPEPLLPPVVVPREPQYRTWTGLAGSHPGSWMANDDFLLVEWSVDPHYVTPEDSPSGTASFANLGELYAVSSDGRYRVRLTNWPWTNALADFR
jgi:hypothetical protein